MPVPDPAWAAARAALLLDFDGTLVPLAATPDAVRVPAEVQMAVQAARTRLGGALALVTGRMVEAIDALFAPLLLPAAAEHGLVLRADPALPPQRLAAPVVPPPWVEAARALAARHPGALVEEKPAGLVLHYRRAPDAEARLWAAMQALAGGDADFALVPAHMAIEVRPRGIGKGDAVRALMQAAPFAGRLPLFVGDDVTDEDAIAAAKAMGGIGLRMQESFGVPASLCAWLAQVAGGIDAPAV